MIDKLLLIFSFVMLLEQTVSTVNNDANAKCGTINYKFYPQNQGCRILDDFPENGTIFCASSPKPQLIPIREYPRLFKIGIPLDLNYDYTYCGTNFISWSLEQYLLRQFSGYPNVPDEWRTNCWKHRALAAVTHLKGDFYIKAHHTTGGGWDAKGQFGPFFYRMNQDVTPAERTFLNKLEVTSIQGFESYDSNSNIAYFNFFLPSSMKDTDQTVMTWRQHESKKTDFEVGVDVVSLCKDGISGQSCQPQKSEIASAFLESYIPRITMLTEATITSATLKSDKLQLALQWSNSEKNQFTAKVFQQYPEACKPRLIVIVYDSNPAPHGNTGDAGTYKNDKVRSVFTTFSKVLAWDSSRGQVEDTFELYSSQEEQIRMRRRLTFLKNINNWVGGEADAMIFYQSWAKENGLSIAITTCICYYELNFSNPNNLWIEDRNRGCREYKHNLLSVDATYWSSL